MDANGRESEQVAWKEYACEYSRPPSFFYCWPRPHCRQPRSPRFLFEGARLIAGDGSAPVENSAFLVENNRFTPVLANINNTRRIDHVKVRGKKIDRAAMRAPIAGRK
jgi:hypothetical protein